MGSAPTDPYLTSKTSEPIRVAVVGGGMGGLALAIGLLKYPHLSVNVYEAAHHFSEIGAGVAFGPNAQRAMELISSQVRDAFLRQATYNTWKTWANTWAQFRAGAGPLAGSVISEARNETGQISVHRAHFLDELVKLIPARIAHFGKRLVTVEDNGLEGCILHFADGSTATADCVVGADGIHSAARKHILGADHPALDPTFTGTVAYRGIVSTEKATEKIGSELAQNTIMWFGDGGVVTTYPIDGGKILNIVVMKHNLPSWDHDAFVIPASAKQIQKEFSEWNPTVHKIIELIDNPTTVAWSLWDAPAAPTYYKGLVCMIGDAAHATTPFQGSGAGSAIEDAMVMEKLLGRVTSQSQIPAAFAAYDTVRRPRTQRIVTTSREAGQLYGTTITKDNWDSYQGLFERRMDWIWHKDLTAHTDEAIAIMSRLIRDGSL